MRFKNKSLLSLLSFLILFSAHAKHSIPLNEDNKHYQAQVIWPDIIIPWGMVQLPDGRMLATERSGNLWLLAENQQAIEISNLPTIHARGQGGLLDIALHPDFTQNNLVFFTYSSSEGEGSNTVLMRAKLDLKSNKLTDKKIFYKAEGSSNSGNHYGSRIAISNNYIYFSIGDRSRRNTNPQDISLDNGKIYRLNLDGSIPDTNPFYHNNDAKKAIYSYGHRNPQGLISFGHNGKIWSHEHGPQGGDEVNLIESGKNYGWPVISYGVNYGGSKFTNYTAKPGMEQPKLYWDPSIAPSGMAYITSDKYPQWQGKVLLGSMKFTHVVLLDIKNDRVIKQTKILADVGGRVRNVIQGKDGYIYLGIDGRGIMRVIP